MISRFRCANLLAVIASSRGGSSLQIKVSACMSQTLFPCRHAVAHSHTQAYLQICNQLPRQTFQLGDAGKADLLLEEWTVLPLNLYKIKYSCPRLTRWRAHTFTYINLIVCRVSQRTSVNQLHNQDRMIKQIHITYTELQWNNITIEFTNNNMLPSLQIQWLKQHSFKMIKII